MKAPLLPSLRKGLKGQQGESCLFPQPFARSFSPCGAKSCEILP